MAPPTHRPEDVRQHIEVVVEEDELQTMEQDDVLDVNFLEPTRVVVI